MSRRAALVVIAALFAVPGCSDDDGSQPDPQSPAETSLVQAPSGSNMGAPPLNAGTAPTGS